MSSADLSVRYSATTLIAFAAQLFERAGLSANRAEVLASIFLEADLLGFSTHGMQRVPSNLQWLQSGESAANGDHQVLVDLPCLFSWDARMLPGPWICSVAIDAAIEKAQSQGDCQISAEKFEEWSTYLKKEKKIKGKGLFMGLRISLTGKSQGPDLKGLIPLTPLEILKERVSAAKAL